MAAYEEETEEAMTQAKIKSAVQGTEAEIPGGTSVDSCSSLEGTICEPPQTCLNDDFTSYSYEGYCCLSSCGTDIYSPLTGNSYVTVYKCEDINNDGIIERHYTICERENEGDCENNPITDTEQFFYHGSDQQPQKELLIFHSM